MSGFSSHQSIGVVGVAGLLLGGNVFASGFQITEQSVAGLGRAFAGSGVVGDDASAIFYNPAGMTLRQGSEAQAGITFIASSGEFTNQGSTQTINTPQGPITIPSSGPDANGGTNAYIPNLFFATDVSDRVRIG
jgi:long-chain fatty acid transport protein